MTLREFMYHSCSQYLFCILICFNLGPQDALKLSPDQVEVVLDVTINEARKLALKVKAEQGCSITATADNSHRFVRTHNFKRIRQLSCFVLTNSS